MGRKEGQVSKRSVLRAHAGESTFDSTQLKLKRVPIDLLISNSDISVKLEPRYPKRKANCEGRVR